MKSSVITFPGSNCDRDMDVALKKFGFKNKMVWHDDVELPKSDLVVLPGGFSYGDYLRCGSMASKSKIMKSVINFANSGGMVMGICNGFQILVETGLVPGVLLRNKYLEFICKNVFVKIKDKKNILEVMIALSSPDYKFISRDDYSGTHKKELSLWEEYGLGIPKDSSYIKSGSGMASTINIANEMQAYVLTDRGTWIAFQNKNNLEILYENDKSLFNPYGIIVVSPKKHPHVEYEKSNKFVEWLLKGRGKNLINNYTIEGQKLFFTYN